jgi:hypothetical protein
MAAPLTMVRGAVSPAALLVAVGEVEKVQTAVSQVVEAAVAQTLALPATDVEFRLILGVTARCCCFDRFGA